MQYKNEISFEVWGDYGLFTDPIMRVGGEKFTYQVPTYEALKGVISSSYWKPTLTWYIKKVRIMSPIQTEVKGVRPIKYNNGSNDLSYYTYLKKCRYQVVAFFEWNENRPELAHDRNEHKHYQIAKRMLERGGRRDIFLGTRECQGYIAPCEFGSGEGAYDDIPELSFGMMYHGMTYADEAWSEETKGHMTANFWFPTMKRGVIEFPRPEECPLHKTLREMEIKPFGKEYDNFSGLEEFEGVTEWD